MSDEEKKEKETENDSEDDAVEEQREPTESELEAIEPQEPEVKITLDRYLSKRRPPPRSRWSLIASLILMLGALLMIFTFKNRCGLYAVDLLGGVTGTGSGTAKKAPAK
ncbi:MAG: hypothetical protein KC503_10435 [Myxococcales bacterium]|nr:hypothetical protein [Myxococcales bacterium]